MPYRVKDTFQNLRDSSFSSADEYKAFLDVERKKYFEALSLLVPDRYDSDVMHRLVNNFVSHDFDVATQTYTRITEWPDEASYQEYRILPSDSDLWNTDELKDMGDEALGIVKVSEII